MRVAVQAWASRAPASSAAEVADRVVRPRGPGHSTLWLRVTEDGSSI